MQHKASLEAKVKRLEQGGTSLSLRGPGQGKNIEKYNGQNGKKAGVYNQDSEVQLTKKKKQRDEEDDDEEEVPVKPVKKAKKQAVEEESDWIFD